MAEELSTLRAELLALDEREAALRAEFAGIGRRRGELWTRRSALLGGVRQGRELGGRSARDLLLVAGAGLTGLAALVFTVVSWGALGPGGRAAVLTALAAVALALPWQLARRGLHATAESAAAIGLLLTLLECHALLRAFSGADPEGFRAAGALVITMLWSSYARWAPVRLPGAAAVVAAQFPLPLIVAALDGGALAHAGALLGNCLLGLLLLLRPVPPRVRRAGIVSASISFAAVLGILTLHGLYGTGGEIEATLSLIPFLLAAVALASLWTTRVHDLFAVAGALACVLAVALPLGNLAFRDHFPTAFAIAALAPLTLAALLPDALPRAFGLASRTGENSYKAIGWIFLSAVGVLAASDLIPVLLSRYETASGWTPGLFAAVAAGFALERLPAPAAAAAAAAAAALPSAAGFGTTTTALWFAGLFLVVLALASGRRAASPAEGLPVLAAAWTAAEHAGHGLSLPVTAGTLLALIIASARARTPLIRALTGAGAAVWAGVTAHHAFEVVNWDVPVEALTLPVAVGALLLGWVWRASLPSSWATYGPGLSLAFLPTLFLLAEDPGLTRPLLLGAGSLAVLLTGVRLRLQAPAVIGALTLGLDAADTAAPYAVRVWEAVPQWLPLGSAGLLLLVVGATYERHLARARRLRASLTGMR
ncbi:hypothetical protein GCM10022221_18760 [Actinocorallia aurea]